MLTVSNGDRSVRIGERGWRFPVSLLMRPRNLVWLH
jgi:hypothetical protein